MAMTKRLVRSMAEESAGRRLQLTARHVDQVIQLTESESGRRTELPEIVVERSFEWIWFEKAAGAQRCVSGKHGKDTKGAAPRGNVSETKQFCYTVQLGKAGESTNVVVPEIGRRFKLKVFDWHLRARDTTNQGFLDRDLLQSPLLLRNWRPGDSFRPQGRGNVLKLKQLLRTSRIGLRDRNGWPVLTSSNALAWSRGFPVSAEFAPGKATRTGVVITEEEI